MVDAISIPNEVSDRVLYAATETVRGQAAVPNFRLLGQWSATENAPLNRTEETTGGYDRLLTPRRSPSTFNGSYAERLTYQSFPILAQYYAKAGTAGVTDGNTTPGYSHDKSPTFDRDDIATMTVQHGNAGLGFQNAGVRFDQVTISGDADNAEGAWQFSGTPFMRSNAELPGSFEGIASSGSTTTIVMTTAGWTVDQWEGAWVFLDFGTHIGPVREVLSNTADTLTLDPPLPEAVAAGDTFRISGLFPAGIPLPDWDTIETYGTTLTLASSFAGLATADPVNGRVVSWDFNQQLNLTSKRFIDNPINEVSPRTGRGTRLVFGQIRFEFDRYDEWLAWRDKKQLALRIAQEGPEIDTTAGSTMEASITVPRAYWDTYAPDERGSNVTATFAYLAYRDPSQPIYSLHAKNDLAVLP